MVKIRLEKETIDGVKRITYGFAEGIGKNIVFGSSLLAKMNSLPEDVLSDSLADLESFSISELIECSEIDLVEANIPVLNEFDEEYFSSLNMTHYEVARAIHFGDVNWGDKYVYLDDAGNFKSTCKSFEEFYSDYLEELIEEWISFDIAVNEAK